MHRGNRHGRSEAARLAVLQAADNLLVEKGFAALTVEGIAQRAGVAKQTIYRWWPSKTDILLEAFVVDAAEASARAPGDARGYLGALARFLTASDSGAVFRALIAEAQHDARLADRLRDEYLLPQRARDRAALSVGETERSISWEGVGDDLVDRLDALVDRVVGPIYYRLLVTGQPVTDDFLDELVRSVGPRG